MHRLKEKVKGRTVFLLSFGKSITELENRINQFRNLDICWAGFSDYTILEDNILNKIETYFDIIHDAVPVIKNGTYNIEKRIPDFITLLNRGSLLISSRGIIRNEFKKHGNESFFRGYEKKIIFREDYFTKPIIFGGDTFCWTIYLLTLAQPKRIIAFGADGYDRIPEKFTESYYRPELWKPRNTAAADAPITELNCATKYINANFKDNYKQFCEYVNIQPAEILNCSPNSLYTPFKTISYDEVKKYV